MPGEPSRPDGADEAPAEADGGGGRISRRTLLAGGGAVAAGGLAAWGGLRLRDREEGLVAAEVDELPVDDPDDERWERARTEVVALEPQRMAAPHLQEATLAELRAQALFDGSDLAVRLVWDDEVADRHEGIARFQDAVAVMLPVAPGGEEPPPIFMGWEDDPVWIAQWRASWQADVDEGFQDVEHQYPGWHSDVHHEHDTLVELGLDAETAAVFAPGREVGNPLSQRERPSPVEELVAKGYGTLTHAREQRAGGRGVHEDGSWRVVVRVPSGPPAPDLVAGTVVPIAFAVWQGGEGQVAGRKSHSQWVELTLP